MFPLLWIYKLVTTHDSEGSPVTKDGERIWFHTQGWTYEEATEESLCRTHPLMLTLTGRSLWSEYKIQARFPWQLDKRCSIIRNDWAGTDKLNRKQRRIDHIPNTFVTLILKENQDCATVVDNHHVTEGYPSGLTGAASLGHLVALDSRGRGVYCGSNHDYPQCGTGRIWQRMATKLEFPLRPVSPLSKTRS